MNPIIWSLSERDMVKYSGIPIVFGQPNARFWTRISPLGMAHARLMTTATLWLGIWKIMISKSAAFWFSMLALFGSTAGSAAPDYMGTEGPPIRFRAELSADEQSAPTESPGTGLAEFVLDRPTQRFEWKVTFSGLTSEAIAAHIHGPQTPGGNAGVLFDLAPNSISSPLEGSVVLNDGELEYLLTGRMYVNIHTTRYPPGELRGQVMRLRPEEP